MAAKYRKIDPRVWKDEKFRSLDATDKLIALYIITAQSNRIGIFNFSVALAAEDLDMSLDDFRKRFGNVCDTLKWHWDSGARIIFLPTWWKYNPPENPNTLKGCMNDLQDLPATYLTQMFCDNVQYFDSNLCETFQNRLMKRFGNVGGNVSPQEQEQEQEQECPSRNGKKNHKKSDLDEILKRVQEAKKVPP